MPRDTKTTPALPRPAVQPKDCAPRRERPVPDHTNAQNRSRARLSGTVLNATRHVSGLTGQPFTVAAVRTAGFTADLRLAASDHPGMPAPGNIISGTVFLSAAIDAPFS